MSEEFQKTEGVDKRSGDLEPCTERRILIVDDEKSIRSVFQQILSYGLPDCRIDLAVNGAEAVESFRTIHHTVLLMDLHMPVMDGEQAFDEISKICEEEKWKMPSVVFCTGYDPSDSLSTVINDNPAHCILRKPINNDELLEVLSARL